MCTRSELMATDDMKHIGGVHMTKIWTKAYFLINPFVAEITFVHG